MKDGWQQDAEDWFRIGPVGSTTARVFKDTTCSPPWRGLLVSSGIGMLVTSHTSNTPEEMMLYLDIRGLP